MWMGIGGPKLVRSRNFYSVPCLIFPKEIAPCSHFHFPLFLLCSAVFPFCMTMRCSECLLRSIFHIPWTCDFQWKVMNLSSKCYIKTPLQTSALSYWQWHEDLFWWQRYVQWHNYLVWGSLQRIFGKKIAFAGEPWYFAICVNCLEKCTDFFCKSEKWTKVTEILQYNACTFCFEFRWSRRRSPVTSDVYSVFASFQNYLRLCYKTIRLPLSTFTCRYTVEPGISMASIFSKMLKRTFLIYST